MEHAVRRPAVAGRFYPGEAAVLRKQAAACLAAAESHPSPCGGKALLALMVPHAGYVFSGAVAGAVLGQAALTDSLLLLGPNHTGRGAPLAVWPDGAWQTPLGSVPVDAELAGELVAAGVGFAADTAAHMQEHSLEVLLPFLQLLRPAARITAIAIRNCGLDTLRRAGCALAGIMRRRAAENRRVVLIVSSDMSHYIPHAAASRLDDLALAHVRSVDPEGLYATVRGGNISMCGVLPMCMALFACREMGAQTGNIVAYATSGQTGRAFGASMDKVVGYAGAMIPAVEDIQAER